MNEATTMVNYWIIQARRGTPYATIQTWILQTLDGAEDTRPGEFVSNDSTNESTGGEMAWISGEYAPVLREKIQSLELNQLPGLLRLVMERLEEREDEPSSQPASLQVETQPNPNDDDLSSLSNRTGGN